MTFVGETVVTSAPHAAYYTTAAVNASSSGLDMNSSIAYNNSFSIGDGPGVSSRPSLSSCTLFLFVFLTVITGVLCFLGFIGNLISMYVLQKDRGGRVHAATFLLQALAVADNCVLGMSLIFLSIIYGLFPILNADTLRSRMIPYIIVYVQPIAHMAQTSTVWMTVLLALNRYVAICRPFDTHRLASLRMTKIQVMIVFLLAFVLNVPRFFEYSIQHRPYTAPDGTNYTLPKNIATGIGPRTLFGMVYTKWLYTIIVLLLPLLLLVVLNSKLIIELRRMGRRRNSLAQNERRSEENITQVMIVIIIIFIVCNVPDRVNEIIKYFTRHPPCSAGFYFDCVSQFLIVANSSTNFLVYYIFRRRFRQVLVQRLCILCSGGRDRSSLHAEENGMNGHSNYSEPRQTMTLLSTNGLGLVDQPGTVGNQLGDNMLTIV